MIAYSLSFEEAGSVNLQSFLIQLSNDVSHLNCALFHSDLSTTDRNALMQGFQEDKAYRHGDFGKEASFKPKFRPRFLIGTTAGVLGTGVTLTKATHVSCNVQVFQIWISWRSHWASLQLNSSSSRVFAEAASLQLTDVFHNISNLIRLQESLEK